VPTPIDFSTICTQVAGVGVAELARQFGTPTYVYDAAKITERLDDLRQFDVVRYAQKACSNLAILDLVRQRGGLVDTVSAGEIRRAWAAGYTPGGEPAAIVYTADVFDHEALELVIEHGIHVNCGSPDMIDQLGERAPGGEITLRVNPGFGHGHSQKTNTGGEQSKHGIWHQDLGDCGRRAEQAGVRISGLHMHIGSGTDMVHLSRVSTAMEKTVRQFGPSIHTISAGGGLPVPYRPEEQFVDVGEYFRIWDTTRKRLESKLGHPIRLEIEPGRYVTAESGWLICEIRAIKRMGHNLYYLVDAGFNNLARPILYGAYHPMAIAAADGRSLADAEYDVVVGGPLCESGDIFTQQEGGLVDQRRLPKAQVGDLLVIGCAGAYGFVMSSNYNTRPLAAEVLVRDGQAHLVRRRQTFDEMICGESIPAAQ